MARPSWPMEEIAHLALRCLRHPAENVRLIAQVEEAIAAAEETDDPSVAGRRYREAVLLADVATLSSEEPSPRG